MMKHGQQARFYAFDVLYLNGEDLRKLPLLTRKEKLRRLLPSRSAHVLYVDYTKGTGQ
jgi:bifunctional non-homologous end joining protein LigD